MAEPRALDCTIASRPKSTKTQNASLGAARRLRSILKRGLQIFHLRHADGVKSAVNANDFTRGVGTAI